MSQTTKFDVEVLLKNFEDYVNPDGEHDPWFTLDEINQQFAWEDIPKLKLRKWLREMEKAGDVVSQREGLHKVYRWQS